MGVDAVLLAAIALMLGGAKLCADLFERARLPSVLGELFCGIVIGNLGHLGWHGLDVVAHDPQLALLAELGVLVLLFQVGLESDLTRMRQVGGAAFAVATVGVAVPMALGYGLDAAIAPERSWQAHLFLGAVLSATSVGITARVLRDLGHVDSPTGRVVLGAAVIDDVLGLVVLAVVAAVVRGADTGAHLDVAGIARIVALAVGFLGAAILLGPPVSRRLYRAAGVLRVRGVLLAASLAFCFAIAALAHAVGLAPIVGAFAAGLVLDDLVVRDLASREDLPLDSQLKPIGEMLTPIFFVVTGAQVDLAAFGDTSTLALAGVLTLAAVVGKQACALAAFGPGVHRRSVGVGMIPRGEVGLIFAATGAQLVIGGVPVVTRDAYAAIVGMVIATTLMTPPLLAWSLRGAKP
jgi:Kef-type K+ transport system membrane component KefB